MHRPPPDRSREDLRLANLGAAEQARLAAVKADIAMAKFLRRMLSRQVAAEQAKIDDTFKTILQQTKWASVMFWITFLLGPFLQRAGATLVQLQVAMRYNLDEARYWQWYFGAKALTGREASGPELLGALNSMRDGMQIIMRQIDESLDSRSARSGADR